MTIPTLALIAMVGLLLVGLAAKEGGAFGLLKGVFNVAMLIFAGVLLLSLLRGLSGLPALIGGVLLGAGILTILLRE